MKEYTVRSKIQRFPGHAGWHFVMVDKKQSKVINELFGNFSAGWSSLPVQVTLGKTTWNTSIFWSKKDRQYLMGIKAEVRKKESVKMGETITFQLVVRV